MTRAREAREGWGRAGTFLPGRRRTPKQAAQFIRDMRDSLRPARAASLLQQAPPPVFIGGTGGSGTRVITRIAQHGGLYMGANPDHANESRETRRFLRRWIPPWIEAGCLGLSQLQQARMDRHFRRALVRHRSAICHPMALDEGRPALHYFGYLEEPGH